jgi:hypothetical protein
MTDLLLRSAGYAGIDVEQLEQACLQRRWLGDEGRACGGGGDEGQSL